MSRSTEQTLELFNQGAPMQSLGKLICESQPGFAFCLHITIIHKLVLQILITEDKMQ